MHMLDGFYDVNVMICANCHYSWWFNNNFIKLILSKTCSGSGTQK